MKDNIFATCAEPNRAQEPGMKSRIQCTRKKLEESRLVLRDLLEIVACRKPNLQESLDAQCLNDEISIVDMFASEVLALVNDLNTLIVG